MIVCDMCKKPTNRDLYNLRSTYGLWGRSFDLCSKCMNQVIQFITHERK
jgi:hypothetical protein